MVQKRIVSVDVLRGMTVAAMVLVNNPAVWGNAYAPLRHAQWNGLTPTDMIYPFFVFIMGLSAFFSLSRRNIEDRKSTIWHIVRRSILVFAVGLVLYVISKLAAGNLSWDTFRIMGVLQGLAMAYLLGALAMILMNFSHLLLASSLLLFVYWMFLHYGNGFALSADNIIAVVDRAVLGEGHMYVEHLADGAHVAFEPESLLSTLSRVAQFLMGSYVGKLLYERNDMKETLSRILVFGAILTVAGFLIQYGCPFNKKVWSPSFVLVTTGFASLILGILYWITDICGKTSWTGFFRSFGVNPLFLYAFAWCLSVFFRIRFCVSGNEFTIKGLIYDKCIEPVSGGPFGSLIYSLFFVFLVWIVAHILDRKHIYIKL